MKAIVSQKGQVTIPKKLRDRLALRPGTVLQFREERGRLVGVKASVVEDPVLAVTGIVPRREPVDAYLDVVRGAAE